MEDNKEFILNLLDETIGRYIYETREREFNMELLQLIDQKLDINEGEY